MKYMIKERREREIARNKELIDLWMESDTPAQFWLQQPLKVPDATNAELRAIKLHYFKTCHPFIYCGLWILFSLLLFCPSLIAFLMNVPFAWLGMVVWIVVILWHLEVHGDLMGNIKWHEDGKPMDY